MTNLNPDCGHLVLFNTFTADPERAEALLEVLSRATESSMRRMQGFVSANLLVSHDKRHVANYAQWRREDDLDAMMKDSTSRVHMREAAGIGRSFEPICYALRDTWSRRGALKGKRRHLACDEESGKQSDDTSRRRASGLKPGSRRTRIVSALMKGIDARGRWVPGGQLALIGDRFDLPRLQHPIEPSETDIVVAHPRRRGADPSAVHDRAIAREQVAAGFHHGRRARAQSLSAENHSARKSIIVRRAGLIRRGEA